MALEVFGKQLVVWQDGASKRWSVMLDECPHRLAPLSQGRVDPISQCLECPYHGWQFNSTGDLTKIPQLDNDRKMPTAANAVSFPTHITGDLVWAFLPSEYHGELFSQDILPEEWYSELDDQARNLFYARELPYSWDFLMENIMDGPSHFPFAHNRLGSRREDAMPVPMTIRNSNFTHFDYTSTYIRNGQARDRRQGLQRPFLAQQETQRGEIVDGERAWKRTLWFFCIPIREGHVRMLTNLEHLARKSPTSPKAPNWKIHLVNTRFFDSDIWMHDAELAARSKGRDVPQYLYPSSCDVSVSGYRRWWSKHGFLQSPPHSFGPASPENLKRLSRKEQIDPWKTHTRHCSICRRVLRRAKFVEKWSIIIGAVGSLASFQRSALVAAVCLMAGIFARQRARMYIVSLEGEPYPSLVGDRSVAAQD